MKVTVQKLIEWVLVVFIFTVIALVILMLSDLQGGQMKTFRITYTQASENTVEIEANSARDAWALVKSGDLDDKSVLWNIPGKIQYKAKVTEEITKHMASNPT